MNLATEARKFLRSTQRGILSTHSLKFDGYPFGSVAPFVLNHALEPVILISEIAEHTKNINANPKVSLLLLAGDEDLQANARLTMMGEAIKIDKADKDLNARYLRYQPQAASYFAMHDFSFYRIQITHMRYIAGFGRMGWLEGSNMQSELPEQHTQLAGLEASMLEHMNTDHANSIIAYCRHFHGVEATRAEILGIDADGFDVSASLPAAAAIRLRFEFEQTIYDAQSARQAFIQLSKMASV